MKGQKRMRKIDLAAILLVGLLLHTSPIMSLHSDSGVSPETERILIILDLSQSMKKKMDRISRLDAARLAFDELLESIPSNTILGLRLLGHEGNRDSACEETILAVPFGTNNREEILGIIKNSKPVGQKTPLHFALSRALEDFAGKTGTNKIILLSDGEETCRMDPLELTGRFVEQGVPIHSIGIGNDVSFSQLGGLSLETGGEFRFGSNLDALKGALAGSFNLPGSGGMEEGDKSPTSMMKEQPFPSPPEMYLEIIFDASGSMAQRMEGRTKLELAKKALQEMLGHMDSSRIHVGFRAFGFDTSIPQDDEKSCSNTALLVSFKRENLVRVMSAAEKLTAHGNTPIAGSLGLAGKDLEPYRDKSPHILLLSDGNETCGGDPAGVVRALREEGFNVEVYVIGFDLEEENTRQLKEIAAAGNGTYYDARSSQALAESFKDFSGEMDRKIVKLQLDSKKSVEPVTEGAGIREVLEAYFKEMASIYPPGDTQGRENTSLSSTRSRTQAYWKLMERDTGLPSMKSGMFFNLYRPSSWKINEIRESGDFARAEVVMEVGSPPQIRLRKDSFSRDVRYSLIRDSGNWYITGFEEIRE